MTERDKIAEDKAVAVANPTGTVIGGLTLNDLRQIIIDSECSHTREVIFDFAMCLMESTQKSLTVSIPLDEESQKYWMGVLRH